MSDFTVRDSPQSRIMSEDDENLVPRALVTAIALFGGIVLVFIIIGCIIRFLSGCDGPDESSIPDLIDASDLPEDFGVPSTRVVQSQPERAPLLRVNESRELYTISEH